MSDPVWNQSKPESSSLMTQIRYTEYQLQQHRKLVDLYSARLFGNVQQQLTAPSSLLMAGGIGFILSELTRNRSSRVQHTDKSKASSSKTTFLPWILSTALNLISPLNILYAVLSTGDKKLK